MEVSQAGQSPRKNTKNGHSSDVHSLSGNNITRKTNSGLESSEASLKSSAVVRLNMRCENEGLRVVGYEVKSTSNQQLPERAYLCLIRMKGDEPIKGYGHTAEEAQENCAGNLLKALDEGSVIINTRHQLERHLQHESKYKKKGKKK